MINRFIAYCLFFLFSQMAASVACAEVTVYSNQQEPREDSALFKVADVIQSDMVVQQNKPFRIWGTAAAQSTISIQASWLGKSLRCKADRDGKWFTKIDVPAAKRGDFTTHTILILNDRGDSLQLTNLLIGDVWVCTGQSNMTFMMDSIPGWGPGVPDFKTEVAAARYPHIRLIKIGTSLPMEPEEKSSGKWTSCTPESVAGFSAVGYYFGRRLFDSLQIPVGLVANGIPAAACQSFTSRQVMEADPALKSKYIQPFENKPRDKEEHMITTLLRPSLIYNGMIHPIRHLSVRGFLWYQGEGNKDDGEMYTKLCSAMLKGWRRDFGQGNLPFYFVQMPPYSFWEKDSTLNNYSRFREHQEAMLRVRNTGMIVTMDVGDPYDIHPRNKKPVGERLAALALHKTYGHTHVNYRGPELADFAVVGDTVKISFDKSTVTGGLKTTNGQPPAHFYVSGEDSVFYRAVARIVNDQVWISSAQVQKPVAVRYAFTNAAMTNLCNAEGLPAKPFRTDNWLK